MRDKPQTAYGPWQTDILGRVPGYVRPNFCDYIRGSRFADVIGRGERPDARHYHGHWFTAS